MKKLLALLLLALVTALCFGCVSTYNNTVDPNNQVFAGTVFWVGDDEADLSETAPRILILGNSITLHAPKAEIGWEGNWGMAASSQDKDYVHLLYARVKAQYGGARICILQATYWENYFWQKEYPAFFADARDFSPDVIIFRLGENISKSGMQSHRVYDGLTDLIRFLSAPSNTARTSLNVPTNATLLQDSSATQPTKASLAPKPPVPKSAKLIFTTSFWSGGQRQKYDDAVKKYVRGAGDVARLVELGDLGNDNSMRAIGLFAHEGVANHPGDKGMQAIADRIWPALSLALS